MKPIPSDDPLEGMDPALRRLVEEDLRKHRRLYERLAKL